MSRRSLCCGLTQTSKTNQSQVVDYGVDVPPLWVGQVSIAGSAIATLQKELSSTSATTRKIIKPVKSPSPSGRVRGARETPEPVPPPFKDFSEKYQSHYGAELQTGVMYSGGMEGIYQDWGAQVCNLV